LVNIFMDINFKLNHLLSAQLTRELKAN